MRKLTAMTVPAAVAALMFVTPALAWDTASTTELVGNAITTSGSMIYAIFTAVLPYVVGIIGLVIGVKIAKRYLHKGAKV